MQPNRLLKTTILGSGQIDDSSAETVNSKEQITQIH